MFIVEFDVGDGDCNYGIDPALLDLIEDFSNDSRNDAQSIFFCERGDSSAHGVSLATCVR